jgi:hypothetical protein
MAVGALVVGGSGSERAARTATIRGEGVPDPPQVRHNAGFHGGGEGVAPRRHRLLGHTHRGRDVLEEFSTEEVGEVLLRHASTVRAERAVRQGVQSS